MLSFALPLALWLGLAVLPAAAFYFLRLRFRKQPAGSVFLWRQAQRDSSQGRRWRRKSILLFLLQLGALVAITLAAAQPLLVSERVHRSGVVFLLDSSASMGTLEASGNSTARSRWRLAVEALAARLRALPPDTPVAVFRCDSDAWLPEPGNPAMPDWRARDGGAITAILERQPVSASGFLEQTVAATVQAWLARDGGAWTAVLIGDGGTDLGGKRLRGIFGAGLSQVVIGGDADNVGLQALRPAAAAQGGLDATILCQGSERTLNLRLELNDQVLRRFSQKLASGVNQIHVDVGGAAGAGPDSGAYLADFSGSGPGSSQPSGPLATGLYRLAIDGTADSLAADDSVLLAVNAPQAVNILHIGGANPFFQAALSAQGVNYRQAAAWESPPAGTSWDLVIADGVTLPAGLAANQFCLGSLPPGSPLAWGAPLSGELQAVASSHPLARWVDWQDCRVASGRALVVPAGVQVLARVGDQPVMAAWESAGRRFVACGTDLFRSSMGLSGAFPVFLRNLILWCVPQAGNPLADTLEAGRTSWRSEGVAWKLLDGPVAVQAAAGGSIGLTGLAPGVARWQDGARTGWLAVNPPRSESRNASRTLPGMALAGTAGAQTAAANPDAPPVLRRSLLPILLVPLLLGMAFLVAEWLLWYGLPAWLLPAWLPRFRRGGQARKAPTPSARRTVRPLFALRLTALGLLVLALTGLAVPLPSQRQNLAILIDTSASMGPETVALARNRARAYLQTLHPIDRAVVISFAAAARLETALADPAASLAALDQLTLDPADGAGQTDLRAALALARQTLEGLPGRSSVLLLGDGRPTTGGGLAALAAEGLPWPVHCLPLGQAATNLRVGELAAPGQTHAGETRALPWSITSATTRTLTLRTSVDGATATSTTLRLAAGVNVVELPVTLDTPGRHTLEASLADATGVPLPGSARATIIEVGGPPRVLLVDGERSDSPLATALTTQGIKIERIGVEGLPDNPAGLDGVSAVILDNIGALDLSESQQTSLVGHVAAGGGLLVVGGDQSLGRGEYYSTSLEDLLPVRTDERQRLLFTRSRLLFVLDHSGSMGEVVGNDTKLQVAMRGISGAVERLSPLDEVGILTFDSSPTWLLRFIPVSQKDSIRQALANVPEGGGTDMAAAMDEVAQAFARPGPTRRHVILLTDGETADESAHFEELAAQLRAVGVSITTIGIGEEINSTLLKKLADWGQGSFYRAKADEVPRILTKETVRVTRELIQEGRFTPRFQRSGGPVAGLEGKLPDIAGYLICTAREPAQVWLTVDRAAPPDAAPGTPPSSDPLLASWRYGNGAVAVFSGDSGRRWLPAWSGSAVYNRFWSQLVRSLEQARPDQGLQLSLNVDAGQATIAVDALDAGRNLESGLQLVADDGSGQYNLSETAPGHYQATVPLEQAGLVGFNLRETGGQRSVAAWSWNQSGGDDAGLGPDLPGLGRLSAATGGLLLPRDSIMDLPRPAGRESLPLAWLLIAASCLVFLAELAWRSTMTGQLPMAKAHFLAWWQGQKETFERYRRGQPEPGLPRHTEEEQRKVMDAYRYLAMRSRARAARNAAATGALGNPVTGAGAGESSPDDRLLDADRPRRSWWGSRGGKR